MKAPPPTDEMLHNVSVYVPPATKEMRRRVQALEARVEALCIANWFITHGLIIATLIIALAR